jgi:hypothetical protein
MFNKVRVTLGEGYLDRYTIFEDKKRYSLYFHVFNTIRQDRFHTHAFDGWANLLRGGYEEEVKKSDGSIHKKWVGPGLRFIPKDYNHRLLRSIPNTCSIVLVGPWCEFWTEENEEFVRTLTWGRKEVSRTYKERNLS